MGTISTSVSTVVITASRTDSMNASVNPLWLQPPAVNALKPANFSAAYSGMKKYSPAIIRMTQRQTGKPAPPRGPAPGAAAERPACSAPLP